MPNGDSTDPRQVAREYILRDMQREGPGELDAPFIPVGAEVDPRQVSMEFIEQGGYQVSPFGAALTEGVNTALLGIPRAAGLIGDYEHRTFGQKAGAAVGSLVGFIGGPVKLARLPASGLSKAAGFVLNKAPVVGKTIQKMGPKAQFVLQGILDETATLSTASVLAEAGPIATGEAPLVPTAMQGALMGLAFGITGKIASPWARIPIMSSVTSVPTYLTSGDIEETIVQAGLGAYFGVRAKGIPEEVRVAEAKRRSADRIMQNAREAGIEMSRETAEREAELLVDSMMKYLEQRRQVEVEPDDPSWVAHNQAAALSAMERVSSGAEADRVRGIRGAVEEAEQRQVERGARQILEETVLAEGTARGLLPAPETGFEIPALEVSQRSRGVVAAGEGRRVPEPTRAEPEPRGTAARIQRLEGQRQKALDRFGATEDPALKEYLDREIGRIEQELQGARTQFRFDQESEDILSLRGEVIPVTEERQARWYGELLSRMGWKEAGSYRPRQSDDQVSAGQRLQMKMAALRGGETGPEGEVTRRDVKAFNLRNGEYVLWTKDLPPERPAAEAGEAPRRPGQELVKISEEDRAAFERGDMSREQMLARAVGRASEEAELPADETVNRLMRLVEIQQTGVEGEARLPDLRPIIDQASREGIAMDRLFAALEGREGAGPQRAVRPSQEPPEGFSIEPSPEDMAAFERGEISRAQLVARARTELIERETAPEEVGERRLPVEGAEAQEVRRGERGQLQAPAEADTGREATEQARGRTQAPREEAGEGRPGPGETAGPRGEEVAGYAAVYLQPKSGLLGVGGPYETFSTAEGVGRMKEGDGGSFVGVEPASRGEGPAEVMNRVQRRMDAGEKPTGLAPGERPSADRLTDREVIEISMGDRGYTDQKRAEENRHVYREELFEANEGNRIIAQLETIGLGDAVAHESVLPGDSRVFIDVSTKPGFRMAETEAGMKLDVPPGLQGWIRTKMERWAETLDAMSQGDHISELHGPGAVKDFLARIGESKDNYIAVPQITEAGEVYYRTYQRNVQQARAEDSTVVNASGIDRTGTVPEVPNEAAEIPGVMKYPRNDPIWKQAQPKIETVSEELARSRGETIRDAAAVVDEYGRLWLAGNKSDPPGTFRPYKPGSWLNGPFYQESPGLRTIEPGDPAFTEYRFISKREWNAKKNELRKKDREAEKESGAEAGPHVHPNRGPLYEGVVRAIRNFASTSEDRPRLQGGFIHREGGSQRLVSTDGHKLIVIDGLDVLPRGMDVGYVDHPKPWRNDPRVYQPVKNPYPNYKMVFPAEEGYSTRVRYRIKDLEKSLDDAGQGGKEDATRHVFLIVRRPTAESTSTLVKTTGATKEGDLSTGDWINLDGNYVRDVLSTMRGLGFEEIDLWIPSSKVQAMRFIGAGEGHEGVRSEGLLMPIRHPDLPEGFGKGMKELGGVLAERQKLLEEWTSANSEGNQERANQIEQRLQRLEERARKMGAGGLPAVEGSLGAARPASLRQNRKARAMQKDLGLSEEEYQKVKMEVTGKRHMLPKGEPGEEGYIEGMYAEEATRVIRRLAHMFAERGMERAEGRLRGEFSDRRMDAKTIQEEAEDISRAFGQREGEYPEPSDQRSIGFFSLFRPVRHVFKRLERQFKAYSLIYRPLRQASLAAFDEASNELKKLRENINPEVLASEESSVRVNRLLENEAEGFQERLMGANEAEVQRISQESGATVSEVRAAKYLRQRYDHLRSVFGALGLDLGYVYAYSPRVAEEMDLAILNMAFPNKVPEDIYFSAQKSRTGYLERHREDAFELFAEYVRKGYRKGYLQKPIDDVRWHLQELARKSGTAERAVKELVGRGQTRLNENGQYVFLGDDRKGQSLLFAARSGRGLQALRDYTESYMQRLLGHPSQLDHRLAESIRGFARRTGIGRALEKVGVDLNRDSLVTDIADFMVRMGYLGGLGFRPLSAIKNLTQQNNTIADIGFRWWIKGISESLKQHSIPGGKTVSAFDYLREHGILREFAPEYYKAINVRTNTMKKLQDKAMGMFQFADYVNRSVTYFGARAKFDYYLGEHRAGRLSWEQFLKKSGLSGEPKVVQDEIKANLRTNMQKHDANASHLFGESVTARTQYLYNREDAPLITRSAAGRIGWQYMTWPENYTEMFADWLGAGEQGVQWQKLGRWAVSSLVLVALLEQIAEAGLESLSPDRIAFAGPYPVKRNEYGQFALPLPPAAQLGWDLTIGGVALAQELQAGKEGAVRRFVQTNLRDLDPFIPGHSALRDLSPFVTGGEKESMSRILTNMLFPPEDQE